MLCKIRLFDFNLQFPRMVKFAKEKGLICLKRFLFAPEPRKMMSVNKNKI